MSSNRLFEAALSKEFQKQPALSVDMLVCGRNFLVGSCQVAIVHPVGTRS